MKITLFGYGKMGKEVEAIALSSGHTIQHIFDAENITNATVEVLQESDVIIDFSTPDSAYNNIIRAFDAKVPIVVGTTGWYDHFDEVKKKFEEYDCTLFYATNFSIGVNLFFRLNRMFAKLMNSRTEYDVLIEEVHHTQKLDSPSGTAITLAEGLIEELDRKNSWKVLNRELEGIAFDDELQIIAHREEDVKGIHTIKYISGEDKIELKHEAFNRKGFASGAVKAAEWVVSRKGIFNMNDLLKDQF